MSDTLVGTFTASPQDDRILLSSHGLLNGDQVLFVLEDPATSVLPFPLNDADYYFVLNARGNDFMVSSTSGGAVINLTDRGSGANQVWKKGDSGEPELNERQMSSTVVHQIADYHFAMIKLVN
jgi:hypothetical protein